MQDLVIASTGTFLAAGLTYLKFGDIRPRVYEFLRDWADDNLAAWELREQRRALRRSVKTIRESAQLEPGRAG
jgi:hypothetical protein